MSTQETDSQASAASRQGQPAAARRETAERVLSGIAVSPGIAIGRVFGIAEKTAVIVHRKIAAADIQAETARLEAAILQSRKQIGKLQARLAVLPEESQAEIAPLFDAYLQMLGNSRLVRGVRRLVADRLLAAESAVVEETEVIAKVLAAQGQGQGADEEAASARRAEEVREIGRRLIRNLTHTPFRSFADLPEGAILACETLRPADAALLDPTRLAAVVTDDGGTDGHTAVMLRSLGLPAVLGIAGLSEVILPGDLAIVDGGAGLVIVNPLPAALAEAKRKMAALLRARQRFARLRRLPAQTRDGALVSLQANLELPVELPLVAQSGAHGIGLLRTEFLFMNRETVPDEDTQTDSYRQIIEAMGGDTVTIRVLDWGGEKDIEALQSEGIVSDISDTNPALGLRGIRLLLRRQALLETQFAAILRAAVAGPVGVMLPMVTHAAEVRQAREVYKQVAEKLQAKRVRIPERLPPLGVMVETPAAALTADALAGVAEFFAIGTNDLTAYTLAVDRGESAVADLYEPLHPAVLRLIQFTAAAAARWRIPLSVCGEMAANPRLTPLLLGLGLRSFSMNAGAVPRVKQVVRDVTIEACTALANEIMEYSEPALTQARLLRFAQERGG